jgi:hypothetical protein
MELVEINVIGLQQPQRLLKLLPRFLFGAPLGLAGEKDILAIGLERRTQPLLRIT